MRLYPEAALWSDPQVGLPGVIALLVGAYSHHGPIAIGQLANLERTRSICLADALLGGQPVDVVLGDEHVACELQAGAVHLVDAVRQIVVLTVLQDDGSVLGSDLTLGQLFDLLCGVLSGLQGCGPTPLTSLCGRPLGGLLLGSHCGLHMMVDS